MIPNKKHQIYTFIVALMLILSPVGLQAETEFEIYTNVTSGYSIEYASNWQVVKSQYPDGGTHFIETGQNPPTAAINVNILKTTISVTQAAESSEDYILSQPGMSELSVVSENEISASGLKGIEKLVRYQLNENLISIKSAYLSNGSELVTMSITGSEQAIANFDAIFNHMLNHIKLF